jgi:hypothetical protein
LALATPADWRGAGEAAEKGGLFAQAVDAYRACVQTGGDRDRRACEARLALLEPQAADGFAGWSVLAAVRRDYAMLDPEIARERVQAALDANPTGPAAPELYRWVVHWEVEQHGAASLAGAPSADAAWVAERAAFEARTQRHRWIGMAGSLLAGVYAVVAALGRGGLAWGGAALALALVGGVPFVLGTLWDRENLGGFLLSGATVGLAALLAPRAPVAVSVAGTVGALAAVAWRNGWLVSLGIP